MSKYVEEDAHLDNDEDKRIQGDLTTQGVLVDGEVKIERNRERRFPKSLTMLEELELERQVKAMCRDFPNLDPWWAETILYMCMKDPEGAKKYAEENEDKLFSNPVKDKEYFNKIEKDNPHIIKVNVNEMDKIME